MEQGLKTYTCTANIWLYPSEKAAWHFVTIPKQVADKIRANNTAPRRGWGAIRVAVTIGETTWDTSLFPDGKGGTYLLPIKKSVRRAEGLEAEDKITVRICHPERERR